MKFKLILNSFFIGALCLLSLASCEKEFDYGNAKKAVKTLEFSDVTQTSAKVSGNILTDNGSSLSERGICYSVTGNPTISDLKKSDVSTNLGEFTCVLENLNPGTTYYARAYATNNFGTAYGNSVSFTTAAATVPILSSTTAANSITPISAMSGGVIINSGASNVTSRGVSYSSTNALPTVSDLKTNDGPGIGTFVSSLTGLAPSTRYYIRAYATNGVGTAYGDVKSFTTSAATVPTSINTSPVTSITQTTAVSGGNILADGGSAIIIRGVVWSNLTSSPTTSNSKTIDGSGIGAFTSLLNGLMPGITYYVRAYATNNVGTAYGPVVSFTTVAPTSPLGVSTSPISSITQTSAISGGSVSSDGGAIITSRGVCWSSTTTNPTTSSSQTIDGAGPGTFSSSLTNLTPGVTYYVRAYATNSVGTSYGPVIAFTTVGTTIPIGISTATVTSISQTSAQSGGTISGDGGSPITSRGVCWSSTTSTPTISNTRTIDGSGIGTFTSTLTGLTPGVTYYVRSYATNSAGTAYGNVRVFSTVSANPPSGITTTMVSLITSNSASSGGSITSDGGATVTNRGVVWSNTTSAPTLANSSTSNGTGIGSFTSSLTGLIPSTTYYVRAYASNSMGTTYGNVISFTTLSQPLTVGQSYQGGIIAYIFVPGDIGYVAGQTHGLIASTSTQSTGAQWGCSGISIPTSTSIGTGPTNTISIVNSCTTAGIAARICDLLTLNGYSDWFLPSSGDMSKLYLNRTAIGGFLNTFYWSSSQNTTTTGISMNFSTGALTSTGKTSLIYVRAIRQF